eukprot:gb/GECH01012231.1/.p1 GENE.gb/GECH01012231.1/~~gb/GECH01012231.1/.p1  ORF type:complete len:115 (+),score=22.85 gb/GECH01012231.1/:1-345(+)
MTRNLNLLITVAIFAAISLTSSLAFAESPPPEHTAPIGVRKEVFEGFETGEFSNKWDIHSSMELYNSPTHSGDYSAGSLKDGTIGAVYSPLEEGIPIRKLSFYWRLDTEDQNGF